MGAELLVTPIHERHRALEARMTDFGGWDMPLQYSGIINEHLAVRKAAGVFDVSHMGRIRIGGPDRIPFLQRVLTNDAASLPAGKAHYTLLPTFEGSTIDDAFLYHLPDDEYLLVVNAANREADLSYLESHRGSFDVTIDDWTARWAMVALQGPMSDEIYSRVVGAASLPPSQRNAITAGIFEGCTVFAARTGYTGEPIALEIIVPAEKAAAFWDALLEAGKPKGLVPVGLGARDTLRLEAGLPLFGHEGGIDPDGNPYPAYAVPATGIAVKFSPERGTFLGQDAFRKQADAVRALREGRPFDRGVLPRRIRPVAIRDRGIARAGDRVFCGEAQVGTVTSGTMVPYWVFEGEGDDAVPGNEQSRRAIALAYLDIELQTGAELTVEVRGKQLNAVIVSAFGDSRRPPYFRPILLD
ncbi:glycine cleavage system aminomethyltransferase GcvT [Thermostilla marina]